MEWFTWIMWLAVAIMFGLIEVVTVNFYTIWLAIAAIVTAVVSVFLFSPMWQVVIFSLLSLILVILSEKILRKIIFKDKEHVAMNAERMSGKIGVVVSRIRNDRGEGVVKIDGVSWSARSINGEDILVNRHVKIHRIEGVKLLVSVTSNDNNLGSLLSDLTGNLINTKIIETQNLKKIFDKDIHNLKIMLDDKNIDKTNIEIKSSHEICCDCDIGIKDEASGREFELSTVIVNGEMIIKPVEENIAGDTHYDIALRISIPPSTRMKISATQGSVLIKDNWNADISILDQGDLDIEIADVKGDVKIRSTTGDVKTGTVKGIDLKSSSGDTDIKGCSFARIKTSSGDVEIGNICEGSIQVSSGDLNISRLDGNISIISSSGDVSIDDCVSQNSLSITAKSGDLTIGKFLSSSTQNIIHTTSGDIVIGVDKKSSLVGKCETVSGDISIIGAKKENTTTNHKKEFTVGEESGKLIVSSISGDIDIKIHQEV